MKQRECGGILNKEAGSMAYDSDVGTRYAHTLQVLIWGAGQQQNHFDRILAANIAQWGYSASVLPRNYSNKAVGLDGWDDIKADVLVCDLDGMLHSSISPGVNGQIASLLTGGDVQLPPVPLASLARLSIVLSSRSISRSTLEQIGAVALLYKPFEMSLLQRYLIVMQQLLKDEQAFAPRQAQDDYRPADSNDGQVRVLVVDDHAEVARTIRQCLECESTYDVRVAKDGLEALELCITWQPQCIVTDLLMPWMNGYQVMRSLSAGRYRIVPAFVVLSALPRRELPVHPDYLKGKEIVFIEKPFHVEQLLQAVEQALAQ